MSKRGYIGYGFSFRLKNGNVYQFTEDITNLSEFITELKKVNDSVIVLPTATGQYDYTGWKGDKIGRHNKLITTLVVLVIAGLIIFFSEMV